MPRPGLRTSRFRRIVRKIPGGALVIHYKKKMPSKAKCSCGTPLSGVARNFPSKIKGLAKSKKKPERPYGGKLCPKCAREAIKAKALKGKKK